MNLFLIDSPDMHEYPGFQCHAIQNTEKRVVLVAKQARLWLRDYCCQEIEKDHNYLIS